MSDHPLPAPEGIPDFDAEGQLEANSDCTFFVDLDSTSKKDPPPLGDEKWKSVLRDPVAPRNRSRYSLATTIGLQHDVRSAARGLVCLADRGRVLSVTARSVSPKATVPEALSGPNDSLTNQLKFKFKPNDGRDESKEMKHWFSVDEQCRILSGCLFPGVHEWLKDPKKPAKVEPVHGLVVITGSTNSAKSLIARGLIHNYLQAKVAADPKPKRRPHLVTFEDPIEDFYVEPDNEATSDQKAMHHPKMARDFAGIDYTPREQGKDVEGLKPAFADALRQTPSVFYIGEVRNTTDWLDVLEFAGTGHLVVTTAHAGSLLEAMIKIFSAVGVQSPADRRRWGEKILGVIHMRAEETGGRRLLLPAMWRRSHAGLTNLVAVGLGSVVPTQPDMSKSDDGLLIPHDASTIGRRWFLGQLADLATTVRYDVSPTLKDKALNDAKTKRDNQVTFAEVELPKELPLLKQTAVQLDLEGS